MTRHKKRLMAIILWGLGILVFVCIWRWNSVNSYEELEKRLVAEAGYRASQLAHLLTIPEFELESPVINAIISTAMDDDSMYAIKVSLANGEVEGQRRNYLWEPVPWDNEIHENSIQGRNTLKFNGHIVGDVEVWLSPRLIYEEHSMLAEREAMRLVLSCALWTLAFIFLLWLVGDFRKLKLYILRRQYENRDPEVKTREMVQDIKKRMTGQKFTAPLAVDMEKGRQFQKRDRNAWYITAGMFRQTFARGPALINRLYADGELAGLCHLGRIIEQAAPSMGADKLEAAALKMRSVLNDPDNEMHASSVEECANALQEVLEALGSQKFNRA